MLFTNCCAAHEHTSTGCYRSHHHAERLIVMEQMLSRTATTSSRGEPPATAQGVSRCRSRGNSVTSRMFDASMSRDTQRSSPIAKPPCGGMPCANAERYEA